jgi:hypothetical protein
MEQPPEVDGGDDPPAPESDAGSPAAVSSTSKGKGDERISEDERRQIVEALKESNIEEKVVLIKQQRETVQMMKEEHEQTLKKIEGEYTEKMNEAQSRFDEKLMRLMTSNEALKLELKAAQSESSDAGLSSQEIRSLFASIMGANMPDRPNNSLTNSSLMSASLALTKVKTRMQIQAKYLEELLRINTVQEFYLSSDRTEIAYLQAKISDIEHIKNQHDIKEAEIT